MESNQNNRREFLKNGGAALAATAVALNAKSYAQVIGANDRIRVGIVGCGDRMKGGDLPAFQQNAADLNFKIVAVSDIWKMRRDDGAAFIEKLCGYSVDPVRNNEELYARKDVDAVIIATADFQHAYHGIEAVEAG
ncbi:MAG: Gfo/Idh/MocA family oxidoreductase, partial [Terracidiphilus sp.]